VNKRQQIPPAPLQKEHHHLSVTSLLLYAIHNLHLIKEGEVSEEFYRQLFAILNKN
jgi:hypothetical protein